MILDDISQLKPALPARKRLLGLDVGSKTIALALSDACFPEVALGPLPHLYPFIVNDPGEGTQAKRRAQAVIIDHLTPPMTRAETYGALRDLEALVDEYYDAAGLDRRRLDLLRREILSLVAAENLGTDASITDDDDEDAAFAKLDNYLCELKEAQIRDGLHIFGVSPEARQRRDLLLALALALGVIGRFAGGELLELPLWSVAFLPGLIGAAYIGLHFFVPREPTV